MAGTTDDSRPETESSEELEAEDLWKHVADLKERVLVLAEKMLNHIRACRGATSEEVAAWTAMIERWRED